MTISQKQADTVSILRITTNQKHQYIHKKLKEENLRIKKKKIIKPQRQRKEQKRNKESTGKQCLK